MYRSVFNANKINRIIYQLKFNKSNFLKSYSISIITAYNIYFSHRTQQSFHAVLSIFLKIVKFCANNFFFMDINVFYEIMVCLIDTMNTHKLHNFKSINLYFTSINKSSEIQN